MFQQPAYKRHNALLNSFLDEKSNRVYSYFLGNDSLALQIVEHLHLLPNLSIRRIKVIHRLPGWVVEVKMKRSLTPEEDGNFRAFMGELGVLYDGQPLPPWYIYTTWTQSSYVSNLSTTTKFRWSLMTVRARATWKQFLKSWQLGGGLLMNNSELEQSDRHLCDGLSTQQ